MPEEKNDLASRVGNWLESQGYPLEMRTARELRSRGIRVDIGRYYTDSESGQQREIDIVASVEDTLNTPRISIEVALSIECKSAKDKPWVLITDRESGGGDLRSWWNRIDWPQHWLTDVQFSSRNRVTSEVPLLNPDPDTTGYGLVRAFAGGNEDVAFTAMIGAAKATASILANTNSSNDFMGKDYFYTVAFPVVVVDAPLMMCDLDASGRPRLVTIDRGTVAWKYRIAPNYPEVTLVTIVNSASLPSLAADLIRTAKGLRLLAEKFPPTLKMETGDKNPPI